MCRGEDAEHTPIFAEIRVVAVAALLKPSLVKTVGCVGVAVVVDVVAELLSAGMNACGAVVAVAVVVDKPCGAGSTDDHAGGACVTKAVAVDIREAAEGVPEANLRCVFLTDPAGREREPLEFKNIRRRDASEEDADL